MTGKEGDGSFAAIGNAARKEAAQTVSDASVENAVKEDDDLFRKAIRGKVLRFIKTLIDIALATVCLIVAVRVFHLLFPMWGWLDEAHMTDIDNLLKSSLLIAVGSIGKDVIVNSLPSNKKVS